MTTFFEENIIKKKKLDKNTILKIVKNERNERIFVEFSTVDGKLIVQKSFQDNTEGNKEARKFSQKIKSNKDLKRYLGIKEK